MNSYFRVRVTRVPVQLESELTQLAFKYEASGIAEALPFVQPDLTYDPKVLYRRHKDMDLFFGSAVNPQFYEELLGLDPTMQWTVAEEENRDWLEEWKKGFEPFCLVGSYWVVPSWLTTPAACQHPISIDPGMAFGTGTHATTKMAAYFVYKMGQEFSHEILNWSFLDVGTGTGILAMLAKGCGFGLVTGIEIDPEARRVARENLKINKLEQEIEISDRQIDEIRSGYNVVVANIIDGVLIQIRDELYKVLRAGGHLFLTGILLERESVFLEQFIETLNLQVQRRLEKDEWVGYWVVKPNLEK